MISPRYPPRRICSSSRRLNAPKSIGTTTPDGSRRSAASQRRILTYSDGIFAMAETGPMLAHSVESSTIVAPAVRRRSEPMPAQVTPGRRSRRARSSSAAWRSPDASPALMKMSTGTVPRLFHAAVGRRSGRARAAADGARGEAALRTVGEERDELFALVRRHAAAQLVQRARQRLVSHEEDAKRVFELGLRGRGDLLALETDAVETAHPRGVALDEHERRAVLEDLAASADERQPADAHELVHADHAADVRAVADRAMAGELREIRHDDAIADAAVVRDVHV